MCSTFTNFLREEPREYNHALPFTYQSSKIVFYGPSNLKIALKIEIQLLSNSRKSFDNIQCDWFIDSTFNRNFSVFFFSTSIIKKWFRCGGMLSYRWLNRGGEISGRKGSTIPGLKYQSVSYCRSENRAHQCQRRAGDRCEIWGGEGRLELFSPCSASRKQSWQPLARLMTICVNAYEHISPGRWGEHITLSADKGEESRT